MTSSKLVSSPGKFNIQGRKCDCNCIEWGSKKVFTCCGMLQHKLGARLLPFISQLILHRLKSSCSSLLPFLPSSQNHFTGCPSFSETVLRARLCLEWKGHYSIHTYLRTQKSYHFPLEKMQKLFSERPHSPTPL